MSIKLFGKIISPATDELEEVAFPATHLTDMALPDVLISDEKETHAPSSENQSKSLKNPVTTDSEDEENDEEAYSPITGGCEHHVPCPRCNSLNTRFCYFNNYCLDQPRHFCKECQRYWTNGGAMRDLPVGSGRRKRRRRPGAAANKGRHT